MFGNLAIWQESLGGQLELGLLRLSYLSYSIVLCFVGGKIELGLLYFRAPLFSGLLEGKFELGLFRLLYFRTPLFSVASSVTWDTALVTTSAPRLLAWFCNNMVCFYIICAKNWLLSKVVPELLRQLHAQIVLFQPLYLKLIQNTSFQYFPSPWTLFKNWERQDILRQDWHQILHQSIIKVLYIGMVNENNILNYIVIHHPIFWHRKFSNDVDLNVKAERLSE